MVISSAHPRLGPRSPGEKDRDARATPRPAPDIAAVLSNFRDDATLADLLLVSFS